ncbi:MAG: sensor histidine kinase [Flavobacteriales bacterium]
MRNRTFVYWLMQILGWGLFIMGNIIVGAMQQNNISQVYNDSILIFIMGIGFTHSYRWLIHLLNWKRLNILALIPRIILASVLMGAFFMIFNTTLSDLLNGEFPLIGSMVKLKFWTNAINFMILFFLWSIIYFTVSLFENWKREEIQNLELRAAKTEIELNSFKSQMNPHFMFNSLNSIRALVDEDPTKAKHAITTLSGIMRNNLLLGKKQVVSLREELDLVEKYLIIEKIRFEERLKVELDIAPDCLSLEFPPFMLQTIVENGIKHGISALIEGGTVCVKGKIDGDIMLLEVFNSGYYEPRDDREGFGLNNTRKRLELIYGGNASFDIQNTEQGVITRLRIPININTV